MATICNEVDKILQAALTRTNNDPGAAVLLASSAPMFKVSAGSGSPSSITFTATLIALEGAVVFSIQGGTLTGITDKTAALTFANMTADTAIVTATVISGGQSYTASAVVSKVSDGTSGTVSYTWLRYGTSAAGAGITDDPTGMSYIGLAYNKPTPVESSNPADYQWSLIRGTDGEAVKGDPGTSYYTWIKYSDVADGTGLYDAPTDSTMYIGIAINKESSTEGTNKLDYTWSRFKGGQGVPGIASAIVYAYQRSATAPTGSPGAVTYDYASKTITTPTLANNWLKTIPAPNGQPLYVTAGTASGTGATDDIASNEWSSAVVLAVDGASASLLSLSTAKQAFTYDSAGVAAPAGQTITLTANLQNLTGTATFVCTKYNSAGVSLGTVTLGGSGNTRTLTDTQFTTSASYATVVASLGGQSDTITIVKLADGGVGQDGESPIARFLTNENVTVPTASDGSGANFSTVNGFFKVFQGTADITAGCTFSIVGTPLVATTAPTAGTGAYSVTGVGTWSNSSLSTSVTYRATHTASGASVDAVLTISKAPAGLPGLNTATVRIYQRNTTGASPALPTGNTTYTFATGALAGLNNGWATAIPSNGGGYLHTSAATAANTTPTDTIPATEWAAVSLMSQDGSGTRGAGHYYASGTAWSDATADATTPGSNVAQDRVTISSGTFVMTKYWNGSSWLSDGTVIDGNLIVTNSITASKINSNGLDVRSPSGQVILEASEKLSTQTRQNPNLVPRVSDWPAAGRSGGAFHFIDTSDVRSINGEFIVLPDSAGLVMFQSAALKIPAGAWYTVSFDIYAGSARTVAVDMYASSNLDSVGANVAATTTPQHVSFTEQMPAHADAPLAALRVFSTTAGGGAYIYNVKVELGKTETAWNDDIITPGNAAVRILSAAIGLAHIDKASIGVLSALVAYMGTVELGPNGHIRQGQTAYDVGNGFFLGADGSGNAVFSMATNNGGKLRFNPAQGVFQLVSPIIDNPSITLAPFSTLITHTIASSKPNTAVKVDVGTVSCGTITGGAGPFTYLWSVIEVSEGAVFEIVSPTSSFSNCNAKGPSNNAITVRLQLTVLDKNNRPAIATLARSITFGDGA